MFAKFVRKSFSKHQNSSDWEKSTALGNSLDLINWSYVTRDSRINRELRIQFTRISKSRLK